MAVVEAIETVYLEADASSVMFSGIPSTYEHLQLRMSIRTQRTSALDTTRMRLNGDSVGNYATHRMYGQTSSTAAGGETSVSGMYATGQMPTSVLPPRTMYGAGLVDILDYNNTNKNTTIRFMSGENDDTYPYVTFGSGLWLSTAAVVTVQLYPNSGSDFARGSEFTLYGLTDS